jgi:hypothetical protein
LATTSTRGAADDSAAGTVTERPGLRPDGRVVVALVVTITAVGAVVRAARLGHGFWSDEGVTAAFTQRGFLDMVGLFEKEPNGLLYQLVAFPFARLSESEWALRLPSVVAGILAVPALWWAGRELGQRRAALFASALLAVSPLAVFYSKEARPYAFVLLFACLSFGSLARATTRGGRAWWIAYAASLCALAYSNALAVVLLIVPHVALAATSSRSRRSWIVAVSGAFVVTIPLVVLLVNDRRNRDPLYWLGADDPADVVRVARLLLGGNPVLVSLMIAALVLACIGLASGRARRSAAPTGDRRQVIAIVLWAAAPLVLGFLVSQVSPVLQARFLLVALPGVCLIVGVALDRLPAFVGVSLLALALIASSGVVVHNHWIRSPVQEDWRAAMRTIDARREPGDPVVFTGAEGVAASSIYLESTDWPHDRPLVTNWDDERPSDVVVYQEEGGYFDVPDVSELDVRAMQELAERTGRVFVVVRHDRVRDERGVPGLTWALESCAYRTYRFQGVSVAELHSCPRARVAPEQSAAS